MLKGSTELTKDPRPIRSISWDDSEGSSFSVGNSGCTKIEAYDEFAEHCMVPMIAVFKGDEICARVPAYKVSVYYATDAKKDPF